MADSFQAGQQASLKLRAGETRDHFFTENSYI
jgi:hypothetical protein